MYLSFIDISLPKVLYELGFDFEPLLLFSSWIGLTAQPYPFLLKSLRLL